jgi:hypothetical protein
MTVYSTISLFLLIQPGMQGRVKPSTTRVGNMNTDHDDGIQDNPHFPINSFQYNLADQIRYDMFE